MPFVSTTAIFSREVCFSFFPQSKVLKTNGLAVYRYRPCSRSIPVHLGLLHSWTGACQVRPLVTETCILFFLQVQSPQSRGVSGVPVTPLMQVETCLLTIGAFLDRCLSSRICCVRGQRRRSWLLHSIEGSPHQTSKIVR